MKTFIMIISLCAFSCLGTGLLAAEKTIVGQTAWLEVGGVPFNFLARVDTGANTTSIHAVDVKVIDGSSEPKENVGKTISFQTLNREGKSKKLSVPIVRISTVKNSQGVEQRYVVNLLIISDNIKESVEVNLRDRSKMAYKLLIGRNWLSEDFLVDVDLKADENGENK